MPISAKTMRDLWDKAREKKKEALPARVKVLPEEFQRYFSEYLARRKAFQDNQLEMTQIFSGYRERLGEGGFLPLD